MATSIFIFNFIWSRLFYYNTLGLADRSLQFSTHFTISEKRKSEINSTQQIPCWLTLRIHFSRYLLRWEPANFTHTRGHLRNIDSPQKSKPTSYKTFVKNSLSNHPWAYLYFFIMNLAYLQHTQDLQNVIHHFTLKITIFPLLFFLKTNCFKRTKLTLAWVLRKRSTSQGGWKASWMSVSNYWCFLWANSCIVTRWRLILICLGWP